MGIHSLHRTILSAVLFALIAGSSRGVCLQQPAEELAAASVSKPPCTGESCATSAGTPDDPQDPDKRDQQKPAEDSSMTVKKVLLNLPGDQRTIWSSPFHLRWSDSIWAVPLAGATGVMIGSDQHS